jgi:hypothetical protein
MDHPTAGLIWQKSQEDADEQKNAEKQTIDHEWPGGKAL